MAWARVRPALINSWPNLLKQLQDYDYFNQSISNYSFNIDSTFDLDKYLYFQSYAYTTPQIRRRQLYIIHTFVQ